MRLWRWVCAVGFAFKSILYSKEARAMCVKDAMRLDPKSTFSEGRLFNYATATTALLWLW
jgi:hypothetical protein